MALMGNWGVTKWGGQMLRRGFAFHAWVTGADRRVQSYDLVR